ncbi:MAG: CocE/NonD family hydrolase [Chloroflexi bacterium]|nr:CocE/NonD family hydrolase [Chloroflexota bacterium]
MAVGKYEGSRIEYAVHEEKNVMVAMRDGVRLAADIYRPAWDGRPVEGRFPTVLERTPYNKGNIRLVNTARYLARRGYICVLQDVRGRGQSEDEWFFLIHPQPEAEDGYDTCAWIVKQPWSDGQIGTMGLSYTGATQQALAVTNPPGLKTQFIIMSGYRYHTYQLRAWGAFGLGLVLPYLFRMAREGKEAQRDPLVRRALVEGYANVHKWLERLPLKRGATPLAVAPSYEDMLLTMASLGDYNARWKVPAASLEEHIDKYPDIPVFLVSGWYDYHVWANATKFMELSKRIKSPIRMIIGPWLHGYDPMLQSAQGEVDFGVDSILDNIDDLRLKWFDHFLKGMRTDVLEGPPIRLFIMGGGNGLRNLMGNMNHGGYWRGETDWPLPGTRLTNYYLHPGGVLTPEKPGPNVSPSRYTFDPRNPVPSIGGNMHTQLPGLKYGGAFDQRGNPDALFVCKDTLPLAARPDVLAFQTPPLVEDLEVTGFIKVHLWASSSAPDTDFTAKLIDVYPPNEDYPQGFAMNLCNGILRARYRNNPERGELMRPGHAYKFTISLQTTANVFKKGHRIRLDISSSNFPQYDVNPNTGAPLWSSGETQIAHQSICHDREHPSHIVLPVIPRNRSRLQETTQRSLTTRSSARRRPSTRRRAQ